MLPLKLRPQARWLIASRLLRIHLLNLFDGSPYRGPPSDVVMWAQPGARNLKIEALSMTGSRLMVDISLEEGPQPVRKIGIFDWETGDLVRRLLLQPHPSHVVFLGASPFDHGR